MEDGDQWPNVRAVEAEIGRENDSDAGRLLAGYLAAGGLGLALMNDVQRAGAVLFLIMLVIPARSGCSACACASPLTRIVGCSARRAAACRQFGNLLDNVDDHRLVVGARLVVDRRRCLRHECQCPLV